jgi:hypothetical protein
MVNSQSPRLSAPDTKPERNGPPMPLVVEISSTHRLMAAGSVQFLSHFPATLKIRKVVG